MNVLKRLAIVLLAPIWAPLMVIAIVLAYAVLLATWPFAYIIIGIDIDNWCNLNWENK